MKYTSVNVLSHCSPQFCIMSERLDSFESFSELQILQPCPLEMSCYGRRKFPLKRAVHFKVLYFQQGEPDEEVSFSIVSATRRMTSWVWEGSFGGSVCDSRKLVFVGDD